MNNGAAHPHGRCPSLALPLRPKDEEPGKPDFFWRTGRNAVYQLTALTIGARAVAVGRFWKIASVSSSAPT